MKSSTVHVALRIGIACLGTLMLLIGFSQCFQHNGPPYVMDVPSRAEVLWRVAEYVGGSIAAATGWLTVVIAALWRST